MSHGEGMERSYRRHPGLYKSNGRLDVALKIPANIQNTLIILSLLLILRVKIVVILITMPPL